MKKRLFSRSTFNARLVGIAVFQICLLLYSQSSDLGDPQFVSRLIPSASSGQTLTITNGLTARWEAESITGLADGASITNWPDTSGNSRDASQLTLTPDLRPVYKVNIFGSKPAVRFDGSNDELDFSNTAAPTNFTVFVAWQLKSVHAWTFGPLRWRPGNSGGPGFALDSDTASTSNPIKHLVVWNASGTEIANKAGPDESLNLPGTPRAKAIDVWRWDGTTATMRKNGSAQTVGSGTAGYGTVGNNNLGFPYGASGSDMAEVLVYNVSLSDGDVATVETYLNTKYTVY